MVVAGPSLSIPDALGERYCGLCNASHGRYPGDNPSEEFVINLHLNGQKISAVVSLGQGMAGCFKLISISQLMNEL